MRNGARPSRKSRRDPNPTRYSSHAAEMKQSRLHKDIADYEEFKATTLKAMRKDISKGMSAKDLRSKYNAIVQGRLLTTALTTEDEGVATAIAKDVMDRVEGKSTEKKVVEHRFKDVSDKELDAILKSEEQELEDMAKRFDQ